MVRANDMTCDIYYIVARGGDARKAHMDAGPEDVRPGRRNTGLV